MDKDYRLDTLRFALKSEPIDLEELLYAAEKIYEVIENIDDKG